jgi:sugar lactone lactonase YvrE
VYRSVLWLYAFQLEAQSPTGVPAVDSAAVARASWSQAVAAARRNDLAAALTHVERAAGAWPSQERYTWYRAVLAANLRDSARVRAALTDYGELGLGRDLRSDTTFAAFRAAQWFETVAATHDANRSSIARSRVRATFSDSSFWPEGVDYDPRSRKFYVGSVRHRTIVELTPGGGERELWPRNRAGVGSILGVRVDPRRDVVWATMAGLQQMAGYESPDSTIAALVRVRLSDGTIERRWDLAPTAKHALGDVVVGPAGDVFVTDSFDPVLYRLRPAADTLEATRHPLFRSLQGMAPTPDGRFLYLADYAHGILRLELATGTVIRVAEPGPMVTLGCDGIAWHDGALIAVQNGVAPARVVRFALDATGARIVGVQVLDRNVAIADEPTIGTIVGNEFIYVANSQWEKYSPQGARLKNVPLSRPVLLAVPIGR